MQGFRDALDFCRLRDIGFNGYPFTWCNRRPRVQNVWIRLDMGVALVEWILKFPSSQIHHLEAFHSDHKPILLCTDSELKHFYEKKGICFDSKPCGLRIIHVRGLLKILGGWVRLHLQFRIFLPNSPLVRKI